MEQKNYSHYALDIADMLNIPVGEQKTIPLMAPVQGEMVFRIDYIEFKEGIKPRKITHVVVDKRKKNFLGLYFVYEPLPNSEHGTDLCLEEWESWSADTLDKVFDRLKGIV